MDIDADDSNTNQAPHEPPQNIQETEEAEEEPVIPDHNTDLNINHEKAT